MKFSNLKYNFLALMQAVVGFMSSMLLIKIFGVTADTDAYFIGFAIYTAAGLLPVLLIEQFMFYYHKIKATEPGNEKEFYHYALFLAGVSGMVAFLCLNLFPIVFMKIFAASLDVSRIETLRKIIWLFSFAVMARGVLALMEGVFNAENRFSVPYLLNLLPQTFVALALTLMWHNGTASILTLPAVFVAGTMVSGILGFLLLSGMGFRLRLKFTHPNSMAFIKNSVSMRIGHNVHNLLNPIVINNVLSALPVGSVSCYGYANRFVSAAGAIITGPLIKIFYSKVSVMWAENKKENVKMEIKRYLKVALFFFAFAVVLGYFLIPKVLGLLASSKLDTFGISQIQSLFLALSVWYTILLVESPFVGLVVVSCDSKAFIVTNGLFITVFSLVSISFLPSLGIYVVPFGLAFAQFISAAIYSNIAMKSLDLNGLEVLKRRGVGIKNIVSQFIHTFRMQYFGKGPNI